MNRPKAFNNNINITDNAECRFFGKSSTQQHHFLLKNNNQKDIITPPKFKIQHNLTSLHINSIISKKSLKKQKQRVYYNKSPQPTKRTIGQYYTNKYEELRTDRKDNRLIPQQYTERSIEYRSSAREIPRWQNQQYYRQPILMKSNSTQILPPSISFNRPVGPITQFMPIKTVETNQPKIMQVLHFTPRIYASAQKRIMQSLPHTPRYKMQGFITSNTKIREQLKTQPQTHERIQSQLTLNIPQSKQMNQIKVLSDRTLKSKLFDLSPKDKQIEKKKRQKQKISFYKQQPIKSLIRESKIVYDKNKLGIPTFDSKYDTRRSCVDDGTGRSKITLKKLKNNGKQRLKKMDDVQEIKSMIDSEQMISDDDKESVVLAKLNEYGSLVDTKLSAVDSRPITFMSKLAYQSTTAQKSMVKNYDYINFK